MLKQRTRVNKECETYQADPSHQKVCCCRFQYQFEKCPNRMDMGMKSSRDTRNCWPCNSATEGERYRPRDYQEVSS